MALITGIHHISLKCTPEEFAKVKSFYGEVLGMPVFLEWDGGIMFSAGGCGVVEIFPSADAAVRPGQGDIRHYALATKDVAACCKAVADAGYNVYVQPTDCVIGGSFKSTYAFCYGPCGEEIEFFAER